ncbi:sigma-70 family RNA polymerase sigma factor [Dactylosporangium sp. NPDC048998]|uniref:sigma-70 family RNA polymerase sigma factor n=1 Tax=Dactylosporangium sp. NPDC048998 TaxID=3363976 RepID=UPI0037201B11
MTSANGTVTCRNSADERMAAIHRDHSESLYRFLLRLTLGQRQAAEDLLQETLLRAWQHRDDLPPGDAVRPWLFTVARRIAIDAARSRAVRPKEIDSIDLTTFADDGHPIEHLVNDITVRTALSRLAPIYRNVLLEVYIRERSTGEAAKILNIPEGTVKSRTHHALHLLRAAFRDRG